MRISDWSSDVCSSDLDGEGGFLSDAGDHYRADYDTDALPATSGAATTPSSPNSDSADLSGADAASDEEVVKKIEVNSLNNPTKETISYLNSQVSAALKIAGANDARHATAVLVAPPPPPPS